MAELYLGQQEALARYLVTDWVPQWLSNLGLAPGKRTYSLQVLSQPNQIMFMWLN